MGQNGSCQTQSWHRQALWNDCLGLIMDKPGWCRTSLMFYNCPQYQKVLKYSNNHSDKARADWQIFLHPYNLFHMCCLFGNHLQKQHADSSGWIRLLNLFGLIYLQYPDVYPKIHQTTPKLPSKTLVEAWQEVCLYVHTHWATITFLFSSNHSLHAFPLCTQSLSAAKV